MWTEEQRRIYRRDGDGRPSDLRDAEWARLEPTILPARPVGRPRKTDMRAAMNAIARGGAVLPPDEIWVRGRGGVAHPPLPVPDRPHTSLTVSYRIYADSGNLKDARANNFQLLPCFCQTCSTPILVLVTLPSSSLSDTQR
jgi:transposase